MSDLNTKRRLKFGDSFCVLPFIHTYINVGNSRKVCCISDDPIDHARLQEIRNLMLEGDPVKECKDCVGCEKDSQISERQLITRDWLKKFPDQIDGWVSSCEQVSYDLRYSNLCNLKCQTCGPWASSTWAEHIGLKEKFRTWEPENTEINPDAKRIYFAGGEPFLIKSFSDYLNKMQNKDCEVVINTNATVVTDHMLHALKQFTNVCLVLSIDGIGAVIENIRSGCNWQQIQNNIQTFRNELNPNFMVNTVVQKDNIDDMPNLAAWIDDQKINVWHTTILTNPLEFSYKNYTGKINWPNKFWSYDCVKKNLQVQLNLKKVYTDLI